MLDPVAQVLDRLERIKKTGVDSWIASCPVPSHGKGRGDADPSLSIKFDGDKVLLYCMATCHTQDVLIALKLDWPDLWANPVKHGKKVTVASWTYTLPDGTPHFIVERQQTLNGKRFVQRLPNSDYPGLGDKFEHSIYRLPEVLAQAKKGGEVYVVEGEKCVHAAESLGLVATTAPMGAGKWQNYYSAWLVGCSRVTIVVDNDEAGTEHASKVAVSLRARQIPCRTVRVAVDTPKADLYDHVLAGFGVDDLVPFKATRLRPEGVTTEVLLNRTYPPVRWAVRGLLPAGLAILGGPPKSHKSFMALDLAVGCAVGDHALGHLKCEQGSVLYLSLDNDSEPRLQWRMQQILVGNYYAYIPIEFHTTWSTGYAAITACQEWAQDERDAGRQPLMVVADTLARIEPSFEGDGRQSAYLASNNALSAWSRFATDNGLVVLGIHHDRKSDDENDWMNRLMGSRGITAAAQTIMFIDGKRGEDTSMLRVAGRDVGTADYPMRRSGPWWHLTDEARAEWESERDHNDMAKSPGERHLNLVT